MWFQAFYLPISLFTLRQSLSTSSGAKTLLVPTPFALKMALLDAAIRILGKEQATLLFPTIRDLQIAIQLPVQLVVINSFLKIVRPKKNGPSDDLGTGLITPLGSTIAYREFVSYDGALGLSWSGSNGNALPAEMMQLFAQINYFGKRGSFVQLVEPLRASDQLDEHWTLLTAEQQQFYVDGTVQLLDDFGPSITFERADITSGARITLGKERVQRPIVLPCRLVRSSRGYTLYRRIDAS
jgi:hypothetical protein